MRKAFTLVETLIVIIIIGILAAVLIESYLTITKIAFKIEQEKNLSEEALMITQIFQSIADTATIDYEKYTENNINLSGENGFVNTLYLTGGQRTGASIYSTGTCLSGNAFAMQNGVYPDASAIIFAHSGCQLLLSQNGTHTPLLATQKLIPSKALFKVIPFDSEEHYFSENYKGQMLINEIAKPAFRVFLHLYSPFYQPVGQNNIAQPLQLFFNLNAPLPSLFSLN
ncbi:MAG: prepilin-type N-terminal cleavage/methylation domain-containing protein [Candidatus Peribacteria bacterium]|jgi:prepilin-type N-terminal cleavage/methylation domain-containing protein|nr:prepilin-type N-terminal cleavage/methylation domain-containing protein [Candidatus Peribacteria bacterium]